MRATQQTDQREDAFVSPAARTTIAIAVVAGFFGLLLAAANPGVAAAFALGGMLAITARRATAYVRRSAGICIPGTEVCLRPTPA